MSYSELLSVLVIYKIASMIHRFALDNKGEAMRTPAQAPRLPHHKELRYHPMGFVVRYSSTAWRTPVAANPAPDDQHIIASVLS